MIPYKKEAYQAKKYAFVSDYARFWIWYNYGGLYFDTDVEVIKSFYSKKEQILHVLCSLHLGTWYRLMLKAYLIWKYEIMKKKLGSQE